MTAPFGSATARALFVFAFAALAPFASAQVASVNGIDIEQHVFDVYLESRIQKPADQASAEERDLVLKELTDLYLLSSQPRAAELEKTPDVSAQIELQYRSALAQAVATTYMAENAATDEEIFELYSQQIKLAPQEQYRARHILVDTQGKAVDLIGQLNDGADFAELAQEHSSDSSAQNGGDLGWFSPEQMVAPFSAAVAELDNGAYTSAPVQSQFGWHVIKREESRTNEPPPLDSVREVIKQSVEQQKLVAYLEELRNAQ